MDTTEPPVGVEPPPPPPPAPPQLAPEDEVDDSKLNSCCGNRHAFKRDAQKPRSSSAFDNFKNLIKNVASASSNSNSLASVLEHHLDHLFPFLRTPDHPPYAAMIREAIEHFNEGEGSGKESISTFIKENYNDLPWAHDGMLEHHLYILCKNRDLVQTEDGCYLVPNEAIERSDTSTALKSPSIGTSSNSFSSSSSSSGSEYKSQVSGKRKLLPKKHKEAGRRKRIRQSGKSVFAGRTKSSITRLGRTSEEDDLLVSSEEEESNEVESEEYGSTKQPWGGTTDSEDSEDSDSEFQEQENQKKNSRGKEKQTRKSHGKPGLDGKRKLTVKMQTRVVGRGRGRPRKKAAVEVSEEEDCPMIETASLDKQTMDSEQLSNPDEVSEKQNRRVDFVNEVLGEKDKVLQLLQEPASGDLPGREDEDEVAYKQIEMLVGHTEATTKQEQLEKSGIRNCEQGVNSKQITPMQSPISGKGSGKPRGRPRKQLVFGEKNPILEEMEATNETAGKAPISGKGSGKPRGRPRKQLVFGEKNPIREEMMATNETAGKAHLQKLQDEVPKRRRGRPPKLKDPNEDGKELKKKRVRKPTSVPGRKPGRPPKNDLARQLQMVQEKFQTIKLQEIGEKTMGEDNGSQKTTAD